MTGSDPRPLRRDAVAALTAAGVPSPEADALQLLAHATGVPQSRLALLAEVTTGQAQIFTDLVGRRVRREPLQHLTGTAPFRHLELPVGPGVFVPRPETEILVDLALAALNRGGPERRPIVVDLCTGSGAIALATALEAAPAEVHAVELDSQALAWARRAADKYRQRLLDSGSSLAFHRADARDAGRGVIPRLAGRVDVVTCNPPYMPSGAIPRDPEVRDYDPPRALYSGADGLDLIRELLDPIARLLRPGGLVLIEHGDLQGEDAGASGVPALLRADSRYTDVEDHPDLARRPRVTAARRSATRE